MIDDEEFTAYLFPTDPELWEIIVDPTGMAERTIYAGENAMTKKSFDDISEQLQQMKPEDMSDVKTLGSVRQLMEPSKSDSATQEQT